MRIKQLFTLGVSAAAIFAAVFYFSSAQNYFYHEISESHVVGDKSQTDPSAVAGEVVNGTTSTAKSAALSRSTIQSQFHAEDPILEAWGAATGFEVLKKTESLELVESRLNILLDMIRTNCRLAKMREKDLENSKILSEIRLKDAAVAFVASYCGDVAELTAQIDKRLGPDLPFKTSQRDKDTMLLMEAPPSRAVADAMINELFEAKDVDHARNIALAISEMVKPGGALEDMQANVPQTSNALDNIKPYAIAEIGRAHV